MSDNENIFNKTNLISIKKKSEDITNTFTNKSSSQNIENKKEIILDKKEIKEKKILFNVTLRPTIIKKIKELARDNNLSASELLEQVISQL